MEIARALGWIDLSNDSNAVIKKIESSKAYWGLWNAWVLTDASFENESRQ